jgi:hypothetical protein
VKTLPGRATRAWRAPAWRLWAWGQAWRNSGYNVAKLRHAFRARYFHRIHQRTSALNTGGRRSFGATCAETACFIRLNLSQLTAPKLLQVAPVYSAVRRDCRRKLRRLPLPWGKCPFVAPVLIIKSDGLNETVFLIGRGLPCA